MGLRIRQHKNGWWMVDIRARVPSGVVVRDRKKAPGTTRAAAERWGQARMAFLLQHGALPEVPATAVIHEIQEVIPPARPEIPTLAEFQATFLDGYARANRQKHSSIVSKESIFKHHLVPVLGAKRLDEITTADVQALKAASSRLAPKTVNCILSTLNTALKTAVAWGVIPSSPASITWLKVPDSEMQFYEPAELERLVAASSRVHAQVELLVLLGGDAGLREGEIVALEQADVDHERGMLTVQRAEWRGVTSSAKGWRTRKIPLTARLAAALAAARHLRGARVLYREGGRGELAGKVTPKLLYVWMQAAQRLANLEQTGALHVLRHTFGAILAMRGAPAKAIQELMGHRDLATTMRYMHLSPAAKDSAVRLLEQNFGKGRATEEVQTSPKVRTR